MKTLTLIILLLLPITVLAQSWENSPMNYQNSPMNYNNSPMNWKNSPINQNSDRGIYDSTGERKGYAVPKPGGGFNIYDNEGNWKGYGGE